MMTSNPQRPYWHQPGAGSWPIGDLSKWLAVATLRTGYVCQVLWRERHHCEYRYRNFVRPAAAAQFVLSMRRDPTVHLLDIGIDPEQPIDRRARRRQPETSA